MWGRFLHRGLRWEVEGGEVQWGGGLGRNLEIKMGVAFLLLFRLSCALDSFSIPSPPRPDPAGF